MSTRYAVSVQAVAELAEDTGSRDRFLLQVFERTCERAGKIPAEAPVIERNPDYDDPFLDLQGFTVWAQCS